MKLPNSWNEITVAQYNEIKDSPEKSGGIFSLSAWILAVLLDKEIEEIEDEFSAVEIAEKFKEIKWIFSEPKGKLKQEINLNGSILKLKPINKVTFGEAIDIFELIDKEQAIEKTAAIFYRRWRLNDWGNIEFEPRGYNLQERVDQMQDLNVGEICEVLNEFKKFNQTIRENYAEMFEDTDEEEDEEREPWEEEEEEAGRESYEEKKEQAKKEAQKKHGWFLIALKMANNDPTKLDDVFRLSFAYVMNILAIEFETR